MELKTGLKRPVLLKMIYVGNFGDLIFSVDYKTMRTLSNFKMDLSGNWSSHDVIGKKPKKEFNGPGPRKIKFDMFFDARLGVKPRKLIGTIEGYVTKGTVNKMIIGGKAIGKNKFVITEINEDWDVIYNGGELARAKISVTMEEYC